jgi:hypothetical protein
MIISKISSPPRPAKAPHSRKDLLIDKLLENNLSPQELLELAVIVTAEDLSIIIQRIYDLNEKYILTLSSVDGLLRTLDDLKNARRNQLFRKKIKNGFRQGGNKVILAEGDSWFNYPIILTDIIDRISMEKNMAVWSLASGGDWLLNMLTARHYVEELSVLHPDVCLISGGGNDLVGSSRLAAVIEPRKCNEYQKNKWAQDLITKANTQYVSFNKPAFEEGVCYLSKDFFALLMFFHLQYYFLISHILMSDKFNGMQIITQGYDYPIPSYDKGNFSFTEWYVPFIRNFLGHGSWLKTPLQIRGILDTEVQQNILYAMIYLFNEMMIEIGELFKRQGYNAVFHIDSRDSVTKDGWTDELHPKPIHFLHTGEVFVDCINGKQPTYGNVYVVCQKYLNL